MSVSESHVRQAPTWLFRALCYDEGSCEYASPTLVGICICTSHVYGDNNSRMHSRGCATVWDDPQMTVYPFVECRRRCCAEICVLKGSKGDRHSRSSLALRNLQRVLTCHCWIGAWPEPACWRFMTFCDHIAAAKCRGTEQKISSLCMHKAVLVSCSIHMQAHPDRLNVDARSTVLQ